MSDTTRLPHDDRRQHQRVVIYAFVELKTADETLILTVRNLSAGGVLLALDGHDASSIRIGSRHQVALFTPGDRDRQLVLDGEVVRHEPGAIALRWAQDGTALVEVISWLAEVSGEKP
jgi:hypothetical protein